MDFTPIGFPDFCMGLFFNYPTIWRSFALKTPSKVVIFDQNKIKYLGDLIDVFYPCCLAHSYSPALRGVAGRC